MNQRIEKTMSVVMRQKDGSKKELKLIKEELEGPLLEILEKKKIKHPFGCRSGTCGVCRMEIFTGQEALSPPRLSEEDTLKRCEDDPNRVRLCCQVELWWNEGMIVEIAEAPEVKLKDE